jgi:hypothetical protein
VSTATPSVYIEKPAVPTLWVDTSVVIKLTKIKRGEALQDIEIERGTRLQELVFGLVRAGKLLCPESDQEEEYVAQRLDDSVHSMFASLSLGISLSHRQGIFDRHLFKGMQAYASNSDTIRIPVSTYFHGDPVRELEEVRHERFFVTVGLSKGSEMIERRATAKANITGKWEQLRWDLVSKGQSYEKQLEVETRGEWGAIVESVRKFETNMVEGRYDFWGFMAAQGPLLYHRYWRELGGHPPGWEGVKRFFCSTHFSELPLSFVSCRLIADLMTGNEPIAPGDSMDVELLSVALPVAHYVLTDRRMELRIKQLGLDSKYGTQVYSMSTIGSLFDQLEDLKR